MEMHQEWGTREERGWGDERDGRWVGDTGCDEAVDLICSPAPSFSAFLSVTCVLSCLLHLHFPSHFTLFLFNLLFFFWLYTFIFLYSYALSLSWHSLFYCFLFTLVPFLTSPSPKHQILFYSLYICLGFSWRHALQFIPLHAQAFTPSSFAPLPPTAAASLLGFPPSLCSAVKLVHWGSRKWGLQTIEWREM